jgi:hypothetical protein
LFGELTLITGMHNVIDHLRHIWDPASNSKSIQDVVHLLRLGSDSTAVYYTLGGDQWITKLQPGPIGFRSYRYRLVE